MDVEWVLLRVLVAVLYSVRVTVLRQSTAVPKTSKKRAFTPASGEEFWEAMACQW